MNPSILAEAADKLPPKRKGLKGDPVVWAEDDKSEVMEWLWEFKIPARGLQLFAGDSEHGKSTITCDLAARITSGADWPDGRQGGAPRRVILMSDEEDYEGTILPRFLAAGGEQSRLGHIPMTRRFYLDDKKDLGWLRYHMILSEPALIIVDPLDDYLSGQVDSHASKSVRRGLMAVHVLATDHRVPVLAIMHLNKMVGQNALQRLT